MEQLVTELQLLTKDCAFMDVDEIIQGGKRVGQIYHNKQKAELDLIEAVHTARMAQIHLKIYV